MEKRRFNYHGKTFEPYGFCKLDFFQISKRIETDKDLGMSAYDWHKGKKYDYDEFYKASGNSDADLFLCVDNGNIYIPAQHELFRFYHNEIRETVFGLK